MFPFRTPLLFILLGLVASASLVHAQEMSSAPSHSETEWLPYLTGDVARPLGQPDPLTLDRVVSQKSHAGNGYDVVLPLTGPSGVECRRGAVVGEHTILFIFSNLIASGDVAVTSGVASVSSTFIFQDVMSVSLANVANAQSITLTLTNVTDTSGQTMPPTAISIRFLLGDTNGDGSVNAGDALQTRTRSGQDTSGTNFRSDVNADGTINTGDAFVVRSRSGDSAE